MRVTLHPTLFLFASTLTPASLSPISGTLFFTAFHYLVPSPPSDPVLHLVGASLATGAIIYDEVVAK